MAVLIRTWLGLAVLGAGLIHLCVAASAPPALLTVFSLLGLPELALGVATLAMTSLPVPRLALVVTLLPPLTWITVAVANGAVDHGRMAGAAVVVAQTASHASLGMSALPSMPLLLATALDLIPAVVIAVRLRRPSTPDGVETMPSALPYLLGVVLGGGLVAAMTSTALGGTAVGALAMRGMGH